jgi:hypothetical protein
MGVQEKRMGILYICIITNEMEYYMNISLKAMFFLGLYFYTIQFW